MDIRLHQKTDEKNTKKSEKHNNTAMCKQYEYGQVRCGQCNTYHGEKIYENLQAVCQLARNRGGFGTCGRNIERAEIRRTDWRDCNICHARNVVHTMWLSGGEDTRRDEVAVTEADVKEEVVDETVIKEETVEETVIKEEVVGETVKEEAVEETDILGDIISQ